MRMNDLIRKKRDGYFLTEQEIREFIKEYTEGAVPDYQASALLMAIYFRGMSEKETAVLTDAMAHSGDVLDLSAFGSHSVDKHSTGGVGDKTTLIVAPILAALGASVAKMTGRGLGHTGGTADKLESIEGFRVNLTAEEFISQTKKIGIAVTAQSGNLTPADKKLYALRDVTATVESIPLITASIMSKKLAAGAKNIVLDVKTGSGAFMKTEQDAVRLAENMVSIGKKCGRRVAAVITDMSKPLGNAVGNSLEVMEAVRILDGTQKGDLYEVSVELAAIMAELSLSLSYEEAVERVQTAIESGAALEKMKEWFSAQGGNGECVEDFSLFPTAQYCHTLFAPKSGYIRSMDAEGIGNASAILGAGRMKKDDTVDYTAGIQLSAKTGDYVEKGERIGTLFSGTRESFPAAAEKYFAAIEIGDTPPEKTSLIKRIIR